MPQVSSYELNLKEGDWFWSPIGPHTGHQVWVHRVEDDKLTLKCAHCRESWTFLQSSDEHNRLIHKPLTEDQLNRIKAIMEEE